MVARMLPVIPFSLPLHMQFYEPLKLLYGEGSSLELKLSGVAIEPKVSLSPKLEVDEEGESVFSLGHAVANDTVTKTLQLQNDSPLGVRFELQQESLLPKPLRKIRPNSFSESGVVYLSPPPPSHITSHLYNILYRIAPNFRKID